MSLDRRGFLRGLAAISAIPAPLLGLTRCAVRRAVRRAGPGEGSYGELATSRDRPELALPPDFRVVRLSVSGERMSDGAATPGDFDGMAAFPLPNGNVRLVRNHEIDRRRLPGGAGNAYDTIGGGGTTSLEVRVTRNGVVEKVRDFVSLGGTIMNCAGGSTPWGTWITCEETTQGRRHGWHRVHGYVFEVPARAEEQAEARPLPALGRFVHEAVAVDPASGIVYLTEDARVDAARDQLGAGFYRFVPNVPGRLAEGGRLQALAIEDRPRYETYHGQHVAVTLPAVWVDVPDSDPADAEDDVSAVLRQAIAAGAAVFERLEGCWYGAGCVFFTAASAGDARCGQVWQYRPRRASGRVDARLRVPRRGSPRWPGQHYREPARPRPVDLRGELARHAPARDHPAGGRVRLRA